MWPQKRKMFSHAKLHNSEALRTGAGPAKKSTAQPSQPQGTDDGSRSANPRPRQTFRMKCRYIHVFYIGHRWLWLLQHGRLPSARNMQRCRPAMSTRGPRTPHTKKAGGHHATIVNRPAWKFVHVAPHRTDDAEPLRSYCDNSCDKSQDLPR